MNFSNSAYAEPTYRQLTCPQTMPDNDYGPATTGDLNSTERGSGARFASGKPALDLLPLTEVGVALTYQSYDTPYTIALLQLGAFQAEHTQDHLIRVLHTLGFHETIAEAAHVFDYGRKKYSAWNWAKGMPWSVPLGCAARHLMALIRGEEFDPESGLPHRGHVATNILMLMSYFESYPEGNDLPTMLGAA